MKRNLPIISVGGGACVALFDILGDVELVEAAADKLAPLIPVGTEVLVMPEGKAAALLHAIGVRTGLQTVVFRKKPKYLSDPVHSTSVHSITTAQEQRLYIGAREIEKIKGRRCLVLDDVVSKGDTLRAMRELLAKAEANYDGVMAVFTEGDEKPDMICLGHLPTFREE